MLHAADALGEGVGHLRRRGASCGTGEVGLPLTPTIGARHQNDATLPAGEAQRLDRDVEVGAAAVARRDVPLGQPVAGAEQALAQGGRLRALLRQAAALAQLGDDELGEVARRVERVVLAQVDAVEAVLVEPALDLVGDDRRRADRRRSGRRASRR